MRMGGNPVKWILVGAVRGYQIFISPALPRRCKYYPSCSQYAIDALTTYGVVRGTVLALWRLLRCNPLSYGGYDPVERQKLFKQAPAVAEIRESDSKANGANHPELSAVSEISGPTAEYPKEVRVHGLSTRSSLAPGLSLPGRLALRLSQPSAGRGLGAR